MPKETRVIFIIKTDDRNVKSIGHRVEISHTDQFDSEEAKEESTAADINHLFDQLDSGILDRSVMV